MDRQEMFKGLNKEEWTDALTEQNEYLKDKYDYDLLQTQEIQPENLNIIFTQQQKYLQNKNKSQ